MDNVIHLYYNSNLISTYNKNTGFRYNYNQDDYINILETFQNCDFSYILYS